MEKRERDKLSRSTTPTDAGDVNRETSSNLGQKKNHTSVEFGEKIGSAESAKSSDFGSDDRGSIGRGDLMNESGLGSAGSRSASGSNRSSGSSSGQSMSGSGRSSGSGSLNA